MDRIKEAAADVLVSLLGTFIVVALWILVVVYGVACIPGELVKFVRYIFGQEESP